MFGLTLVDHLRLTFGHVIYTHRAHAQIASRQALWNRCLKGAEIFLVIAAAVASSVLVSTGERQFGIVTAVTATAAACVLLVRLVFDFDSSVSVHRECSARLWHIREQYRALLADMKDGSLTLEGARERRDVLMHTLHAVYENAPPADCAVFEAARLATPLEHEAVLTDEEIHWFLPASLQKGDTSAA